MSDVQGRPIRAMLVDLHEQPFRVDDLQEKRRPSLETRRRRTTVLKPTTPVRPRLAEMSAAVRTKRTLTVVTQLKCLPPYEVNPDGRHSVEVSAAVRSEP